MLSRLDNDKKYVEVLSYNANAFEINEEQNHNELLIFDL
jgi:hypothetical protein